MHLPGDSVGCLTPFADMHNYWPPADPVAPPLPIDADYIPAAQLHSPATLPPKANNAGRSASLKRGEGEEWSGVAGMGLFSAERRCYEFRVLKAVEAGEQLFLCYGHYTSIQLLCLYGFLLEDNPHDEVVLPADCWPADVGGGQEGHFLHAGTLES